MDVMLIQSQLSLIILLKFVTISLVLNIVINNSVLCSVNSNPYGPPDTS